jgi:hypothetical protein
MGRHAVVTGTAKEISGPFATLPGSIGGAVRLVSRMTAAKCSSIRRRPKVRSHLVFRLDPTVTLGASNLVNLSCRYNSTH